MGQIEWLGSCWTSWISMKRVVEVSPGVFKCDGGGSGSGLSLTGQRASCLPGR